ncbi:MAG: imidazoleglycerol-phosphate dehydratase HisB [Allobaculum sp.]
MRQAGLQRNTKETQIKLAMNLDYDESQLKNPTRTKISTPIGFFNHMLELFCFHSGLNMQLEATGDVDVDDHHLVEDAGIILGQALREALGDKRGIARYGNCRLPMDEALAQVDLDFSGRPYLVFECEFHRDSIGQFSTEMVEEFLRAFAFNAGITLHIHVYGKNDHHQVEAIFKGLGRAVRQAIQIESDRLPSTKGVLE